MSNACGKTALETGRPLDYSFKQIDTLDYLEKLSADELNNEKPRAFRVGGVPTRGKGNKYITKSLWLNNNKLTSLQYLEKFVEKQLVYPEHLSWLDVSYNKIREIDEEITKFKNLKILYFHGNDIKAMQTIAKLRSLQYLRNITFHGNPIESTTSDYRSFLIHLLPQLINLDFITITGAERRLAPPAGIRKLMDAGIN